MKDIIAEDFQNAVNDILTRNKSILDIITKYQDSNARVNRAVIKAATNCGCIRIEGKKQIIPEDAALEDIQQFMDTQIKGRLCPSCRETIEKELGSNLFYIASLCNTLDLNMYDIMLNEEKRLAMLGRFHLR